jgi:hypothetical protein
MTRPLSPGAGTALRAVVIVKRIVEEQRGPRCIHPLPYNIMVVEKLPGRSNGSTGGTADLRVADYPVRVRDEGNVVSKVVPRKVLCPTGIHE